MSTDTNYLSTTQADLQARLKAVLPNTWYVVDADTLGDNTINRITVAVAQGDIVSEIAGTGLPGDTIGVEFMLTLASPESVGPRGVGRVSAAAFELLAVLNPMDDLYWSSGERVTLSPQGNSAYRFPVTLITQLTTPAPEEA